MTEILCAEHPGCPDSSLPHWTLIKASCCVCRIGPAIGQGEVVQCEDVHLLIGALVIWYIQNVLFMRNEAGK